MHRNQNHHYHCAPTTITSSQYLQLAQMARRKQSKESLESWHQAVLSIPSASQEEPSKVVDPPSTTTIVTSVTVSNTWVSSKMVIGRHPLPQSRACPRRASNKSTDDKKTLPKKMNTPSIVVSTPDGNKWQLEDMPEWQRMEYSEEARSLALQWMRRDLLSPYRYFKKQARRRKQRRRTSVALTLDPLPGCKLWA